MQNSSDPLMNDMDTNLAMSLLGTSEDEATEESEAEADEEEVVEATETDSSDDVEEVAEESTEEAEEVAEESTEEEAIDEWSDADDPWA